MRTVSMSGCKSMKIVKILSIRIRGRVIKLFQHYKTPSDSRDVLQSVVAHKQKSISNKHNNIRSTAVVPVAVDCSGPMALLKSGSLWRQSSILRRWKLNWCDLWIDGSFVFYKTQSRRDYETKVNLKATCVNVKSGLECPNVCPPESHPRENLLVVYLKHGNMLILCANSEDEALAWKLTLMEAKRNPVFTYNPYDDTYQTVPVDSHNAVYIMPSTGSGAVWTLILTAPIYCRGSIGTQHVWVHRDTYGDNFGEQIALGLLAGMAAGTAMRSLLWMPFWFC